MTLFTNFLTPGLSRELGNALNDWLDWLIPTNHRVGYLNLQVKPRVKNLVNKGLKVVINLKIQFKVFREFLTQCNENYLTDFVLPCALFMNCYTPRCIFLI